MPAFSTTLTTVSGLLRNLERRHLSGGRGFTLVELLTVIAVIGILLALLIPAVGAVRTSVAKSETRSRFAQYATAYELFRADHGYYPTMGVGQAEFALKGNNAVFVETLTGRTLDGAPAAEAYARQANPRGARYHRFGSGERGAKDSPYAGEIVDGLGNPHLHVVVDDDLDGLVEAEDFVALPKAMRPERLHGGVFIYSSNADSNPDWDWILSWE